MQGIGARLRKFDIHVKTVDGVTQQTYIGAFITILCSILVIVLCISEFSAYLQKSTHSHIVVDQSIGSAAVRLRFDIHFHKIACNQLSFAQEVVRGTVHTDSSDVADAVKFEPLSVGCRAVGDIITDKVAGNFRFQVSGDLTRNIKMMRESFSLSHTIRHLAFSPIKLVDDIFEGTNSSQTLNGNTVDLGPDVGIYHYAMQIVPLETKQEDSYLDTLMHEYSVVQRDIPLEEVNRGIMLSGTPMINFVGVVFGYDFYPVKLVVEETSVGVLEFIVNLCAIIGGAITILSLADRCIHTSVKAVIGKKD